VGEEAKQFLIFGFFQDLDCRWGKHVHLCSTCLGGIFMNDDVTTPAQQGIVLIFKR
jgi:thioredoxin reductase